MLTCASVSELLQDSDEAVCMCSSCVEHLSVPWCSPLSPSRRNHEGDPGPALRLLHPRLRSGGHHLHVAGGTLLCGLHRRHPAHPHLHQSGVYGSFHPREESAETFQLVSCSLQERHNEGLVLFSRTGGFTPLGTAAVSEVHRNVQSIFEKGIEVH